MSLVLTRIDCRLVHGQVVETWVPHVKANSLIVANDKSGQLVRCERDRDLELTRCNEFIKRGALVQRRGAFGFVADGDAADFVQSDLQMAVRGKGDRPIDRVPSGRMVPLSWAAPP